MDTITLTPSAALARPLYSLQFLKATNRFGSEIKIYDEGHGPFFILRDSMGINGIVRAANESDAYSIAEDEFFPDATDTHEKFVKEYGENYTEAAAWNEAYGFRPNGGQIYQKDLNGDYIDVLTDKMAEELEIKLFFRSYE